MKNTTREDSRPGVIRLRRKKASWRNRLAKYSVVIDGRRVGRIADGQELDFSVAPGPHRIKLTSDRIFTSPERFVSVHSGEVAEFIVGPGGPAIESLFIIFRPHRYIRLDPVGAIRLSDR